LINFFLAYKILKKLRFKSIIFIYKLDLRALVLATISNPKVIFIILIIISITIFIIQIIIFLILIKILNLYDPNLSGFACNIRPKNLGSGCNTRPKSLGCGSGYKVVS
jgi:hypothetical protein